ncbi:tRNA dihydrouridine(20/20a) synthase DusA [Spirulina subsalsa FACHB-351]|uniref:tRNA-dihydrouridine(20/20a) synthase n=1 Tax=Spirulina subsalsa FACHB-351 TaxID=234711 RepID=A0ABT3L828_9CYAN|nr:tRNA dihydrouridine(20/20a) synthase DusA [Spirulina subsalsa]MCW6037120.1 tRNA dihydrouridine(20/20a) synthase DusA [Spirulina subsalsa FACHB-351]
MLLSPVPLTRLEHPVSVAPMMERTDRHFRYFMRQITRHTLLYTEMITTQAILHGDKGKLLDFSPAEHPLVLQLGGDNPQDLATCAKIAEDWGYDGVNLNVGCPSSRVQDGNFGACLMLQPEKVARAVEAMIKAVQIPVSVKHRIGVDECDRYPDLHRFVQIVSEAGCQQFSVHARKAWLQGLSPKENREIPPLQYPTVHRLKQDFPHLFIEINGGIKTLAEVQSQLQAVDGVMIGRAAYDTPYLFAKVDQMFYGEPDPPPSRPEIVQRMLPYLATWVRQGVKLNSLIRPMLQLFAGQPGTKAWKRHLSENAHLPGAGVEVVEAALAKVV